MSEIFLSYKSEDRERAEKIAQALEADGFSVWWDTEIASGSTYREAISAAIAAAKLVIVCFSRQTEDSKHARWVFGEVDEAWRQNKHVLPVTIEACTVPMEYRAVQGVDLAKWGGDRAAPEWLKLTDGLRLALSGEAPPARPPRKRAGIAGVLAIAGVVALVGAGAAVWVIDPLGWRVPPAPIVALVVERPLPAETIADALRAADAAFLGDATDVPTHRGELTAGGSEEGEVSGDFLHATFVAICDCADIDLKLLGAAGEEVQRDSGSSNVVVLREYAERTSAPVRWSATMADCAGKTCAYVVRAYPRPPRSAMGPAEPRQESVPEAEWRLAGLPEAIAEGLARNAASFDTAERTALFAPVFGKLQVGWNARVTLQLEAGRRYAFSGFCGVGCDDMDIYLQSVNGHYADAIDLDVNPKLEYTPQWSGEYNLMAQVIACPDGQACEFALEGYAYPRGQVVEAGQD